MTLLPGARVDGERGNESRAALIRSRTAAARARDVTGRSADTRFSARSPPPPRGSGSAMRDTRRPGVFWRPAADGLDFPLLSSPLSLALLVCLFLRHPFSLSLSHPLVLLETAAVRTAAAAATRSRTITYFQPSTPRAVHSRRAGRFTRGIKPPHIATAPTGPSSPPLPRLTIPAYSPFELTPARLS